MDGKAGGLSKVSIKLHAVPISLAFKQALHDGLVKINHCEHAVLPKNESIKKHITSYTSEQCQKLLDVTEGTPLHDMIYITFIDGLRRSELMVLKCGGF